MQIVGTGLGIGDGEAAAVLQRRDLAARLGHLGRIDPRHDEAGIDAAFGQHLAPRIDDQRMAVGLALVLMQAALRGGGILQRILALLELELIKEFHHLMVSIQLQKPYLLQ